MSGAAAAEVFRRVLPCGGTVELDGIAGDLVVTLTVAPVAIAAPLSRDDVQQLAQALDDWLYDSRPGA